MIGPGPEGAEDGSGLGHVGDGFGHGGEDGGVRQVRHLGDDLDRLLDIEGGSGGGGGGRGR